MKDDKLDAEVLAMATLAANAMYEQGEKMHRLKNGILWIAEFCAGSERFQTHPVVSRIEVECRRLLAAQDRCRHGVHGTDCFECYPEQEESREKE